MFVSVFIFSTSQKVTFNQHIHLIFNEIENEIFMNRIFILSPSRYFSQSIVFIVVQVSKE